jgi:hypothetical protein
MQDIIVSVDKKFDIVDISKLLQEAGMQIISVMPRMCVIMGRSTQESKSLLEKIPGVLSISQDEKTQACHKSSP